MKYVSCQNIQNGIRFEYNCIKLCCLMGTNTPEPLYVKKDYYGEPIDWQTTLKEIEDIRQNQKNGINDSHCTGCIGLREDEWDDNPKFKWLQVAHWSECNCNCTYCYRVQDNFEKPKKRYKVMPIIKELDALGMIDYSGELAYSGGEPASLDEFDDITNWFINKGEHKIMVHSNAIMPVKSVLTGLKTDTLSITASVDCGDRDTFKKIKQVDAYDKVMNTLKLYVEAQGNNKNNVRSKFIIYPGINDTKDHIDRWVTESARVGMKELVVDFESEWFERHYKNIPTHIDEFFAYLENKVKSEGMNLEYYAVANRYRTAVKNFDVNVNLHTGAKATI